MAWELDSDRPIFIQIVERIQMEIISGKYSPGDKLPSVRDLAAVAAVSTDRVRADRTCVFPAYKREIYNGGCKND